VRGIDWGWWDRLGGELYGFPSIGIGELFKYSALFLDLAVVSEQAQTAGAGAWANGCD
jgi:hypothetical protein